MIGTARKSSVRFFCNLSTTLFRRLWDVRVFKNRFDGTNESTFSTYVQVSKKRMNDEKLNRQQECAYNNDIKCLLMILIYLILQVREPFKTDEDFQSALVCIFSNKKQYDFRWKTQTITYIMTYMGPDQPLFMQYSNRLDWHNPNFQKQKKKIQIHNS